MAHPSPERLHYSTFSGCQHDDFAAFGRVIRSRARRRNEPTLTPEQPYQDIDQQEDLGEGARADDRRELHQHEGCQQAVQDEHGEVCRKEVMHDGIQVLDGLEMAGLEQPRRTFQPRKPIEL